MRIFLLILVSGFLMSATSLVGSATLFFKAGTLALLTLSPVALAAGSLIGRGFVSYDPAAMTLPL